MELFLRESPWVMALWGVLIVSAGLLLWQLWRL